MNPIAAFLMVLCIAVGAALAFWSNFYFALPFLVLAAWSALSLKMANVWEKFVILRMGRLQSVRGAGLFVILPIVDRIAAVIDGRIQTTAFNAEQALTKDTVPVNVDAIIFWNVHDAENGGARNHQLSGSHRSGGSDIPARDDRLLDAGRAPFGPQGSG